MSFTTIAKNVITLGGASRLEKYQNRYNYLLKEYNTYYEETKELNENLHKFCEKWQECINKIDWLTQKFNLEKIIIEDSNEQIFQDPQKFKLAKDKSEFTNKEICSVWGTSVALPTTAFAFVSTLGSASTGTAISSLPTVLQSGVTMSWFGGGSIASGGLGIAGGTMVLQSLFLLPLAYFLLKKYKSVHEYKTLCQKLEKELENRLTINEINEKNKMIIAKISELNAKEENFINNINNERNNFFKEITEI